MKYSFIKNLFVILSSIIFSGCAYDNPYIEPKTNNPSKLYCTNKYLTEFLYWDSYRVAMIDGQPLDFGFNSGINWEKEYKYISHGKHQLIVELKYLNHQQLPYRALVIMDVSFQKDKTYTIAGRTDEENSEFSVWVENKETSKIISKIYTKKFY